MAGKNGLALPDDGSEGLADGARPPGSAGAADERALFGLMPTAEFEDTAPPLEPPVASEPGPVPFTARVPDMATAPFGAENHRERMRERFIKHGGAVLDDYELLEMALYRVLPRIDTRPIAKALLKRFGGLNEVLAAPVALLKEVHGIGETAAVELRLIGALTVAATRESLHREGDMLGSWDKVLNYCRTAFAHEREEHLHVLFLNKRNGLIRDETLQRGTVDHTPVYPREILKRALELSASALILVHTHPSGDPTPSTADVEMTKRLAETARGMDITIHDHLIIGASGYPSLRAKGLI